MKKHHTGILLQALPCLFVYRPPLGTLVRAVHHRHKGPYDVTFTLLKTVYDRLGMEEISNRDRVRNTKFATSKTITHGH